MKFGLPYLYHFDERFYVNTAGKLGSGVISYGPYAPTGLSNILFGSYATYFVIGKLLGYFSSAGEFEALYRSDPTIFYQIGRFISAFLGALTVIAIFKLGKLTSRLGTGLIAAGLLATSFLHVRDSHFSVPDVAMTTFVIFSITLAVLGVQKVKPKYLYLAGVVGGLAIALKWTALPIVVPLSWACIKIFGMVSRKSFFKLFRKLILTNMFIVLGFFLGSPQILINPSPYLEIAFSKYDSTKAVGFEIWQVDTIPGFLFYGKTLLYGAGFVLLVLGIIGALRRMFLIGKGGDKYSLLLLSFPVVYYLLMGITYEYFARYALPLVPFLALFAAETIIGLWDWGEIKEKRWIRRATTVLFVTALVLPLIYSIRLDILFSREDTRTVSKQWIETHIPEGAKIALDFEVHVPMLSTLEKPAPGDGKIYDVDTMSITGLSDHPLEWYLEEGYDFLIASSFLYKIPLVNDNENIARVTFYESLDRDFELIQEFKPYLGNSEPSFIFDEIYGPIVSLWQREQPGPTLKIYQLKGEY